ncbi:MAG: outer membrane beta-barrel protein [bacterium]|nr:outer membrane beta-barrel protein [bacterium]
MIGLLSIIDEGNTYAFTVNKRKNMFRLISLGLVLGILMLLPLTASSQTDVHLGPHLGIQKSQDAEDANYLVGATLRLKLAPLFGVEGNFGYRQEKYGTDVLTVKSWPLTATGMLYLLPVVYGGVGAGWYNTSFDYASEYNDDGYIDETTQKFGWHLAAGIELPASQNFRLFGDVRYVFIDYNIKDVPGAVLDGVDADFYSINFGLLFSL